MTPEAQRIAIAEACGWEVRRSANGGVCLSWQGWRTQDEDEQSQPVPDYLNDLNAMHEAEKTLSNENATLGNYHANLIAVMDCKNATWRRIHATAAQRAEAFLRTLNLWSPK